MFRRGFLCDIQERNKNTARIFNAHLKEYSENTSQRGFLRIFKLFSKDYFRENLNIFKYISEINFWKQISEKFLENKQFSDFKLFYWTFILYYSNVSSINNFKTEILKRYSREY